MTEKFPIRRDIPAPVNEPNDSQREVIDSILGDSDFKLSDYNGIPQGADERYRVTREVNHIERASQFDDPNLEAVASKIMEENDPSVNASRVVTQEKRPETLTKLEDFDVSTFDLVEDKSLPPKPKPTYNPIPRKTIEGPLSATNSSEPTRLDRQFAPEAIEARRKEAAAQKGIWNKVKKIFGG